jgi:multidrug efflux pump subunit AcrA (membrane-fusion protein)
VSARRWRWTAGGTLGLALGLSAAAWVRGAGDGGATAPVVRQDFAVSVKAPGQLEAAVTYEIGPPSVEDVWDYNLTWMIAEGSLVPRGEVVARFDATQLEERLRDHRAALEKVLQEKEKEQRNLEVALRELQLELVKAQGELEALDLDLSVPEELMASIEVERMRLERGMARQRADFLREKIEFERGLLASKLRLLDLKRAYEEGKIAYTEGVRERFDVRSPVSGRVIYIPKRNGDRWEIGESVWMLAKILEIADVSTLQVKAHVLEMDASRVAPGQAAEITVDALPGMVLASEVAAVGKIVRQRSLQDRSKVFDAYLPLGAFDPEQLRPGMGVRVGIRTEVQRDRLTVPLDAVQGSAAGPCVEVVRDGRTERRAVELGERDEERVVVVSGLAEGERVRVPGGAA